MDKRDGGLQIAFGLVDYDGDADIQNQPEYGEVKVSFKRWGPMTKTHFEGVEIRPCTEQELGTGPDGFDSPESKFYPISELSEGWLLAY